MDEIRIGGTAVGPSCKPLIVAEMSGNHNQSLSRALAIVEAASKAGADAIKLQTYTADSLTLDVKSGDFVIRDAQSLWNGRSLYSLYQEAATPRDWHRSIFDHCRELGMLCFSAPFDESAVDFLESLDAPAYKIASFEIVHLPLIRRAASTGKPIIISTGMASVSEINDAVTTARDAGCKDIVLLKCTSTYPATPENTNVRTIPHLRELFHVQVGISDHTMGVGASVAAVALGATLIEKHFTLLRADGGVDSAFSLEPEELRALVVETERAWQSLGTVSYGPTEREKPSLQFRRSLYVARDMNEGEVFTPDNLRIVRPGNGLHPKYYELFLGRSVKKAVRAGTPVTFDLL